MGCFGDFATQALSFFPSPVLKLRPDGVVETEADGCGFNLVAGSVRLCVAVGMCIPFYECECVHVGILHELE
jgi:hypothetical protein